MSTLRVSVPRKLAPLLKPARYKGAYGGRGGAKSHFFAEQLIIQCVKQQTRAVCIREVQNSIKDSVRQLLIDKITNLNILHLFEILESEIRGPNGSFIVFKGMQSYNAANIKSLEAFDIAWVEEAQTLSQHSLDLLRPTIRKENSELWFSWNPRFKTDPVDMLFRKSPPPDAISVLVNWNDNPWFPDVLRREMFHDFATDPDKAEHIWNGAYGSSQGAILARWVNNAQREGRIGNSINYDVTGGPVEISCDLGFRDTASFWYWQRLVGGYNLLKCDSDTGLDAEEWIPRIYDNLQAIGCNNIKIWLPHDARAKTFQSKETVIEKFIKAFGHDNCAIVPQSKKQDQISAARTVIDQCAFNETECEYGLDALRAWEFEYNEETGIMSREPLHNWASHPADAFAYGCQVMQLHKSEKTANVPLRGPAVGTPSVTLNEMWKTAPKPSGRI